MTLLELKQLIDKTVEAVGGEDEAKDIEITQDLPPMKTSVYFHIQGYSGKTFIILDVFS